MRDFKPRNLPHIAPSATTAIPATHVRALDRRQLLDEQQRAFRGSGMAPPLPRPRPPA